MKIKMIDLLVKIANGEEVPKKIKFMSSIWEYCKDGTTQDYINDYDKCLMEFIAINKDGLNDEVEIIEEPKKIEKITVREKTLGFPNGEWTARNMDKAFAIKINELIDGINNLKEK